MHRPLLAENHSSSRSLWEVTVVNEVYSEPERQILVEAKSASPKGHRFKRVLGNASREAVWAKMSTEKSL